MKILANWQYYVPPISWVACVIYWFRNKDDYAGQIGINIKVIVGHVVLIGLAEIFLCVKLFAGLPK